MKTQRAFFIGCLIIATSAAWKEELSAAPVAWYPGPSLEPMSGAATVFMSSRGNILVGGDAYLGYYYPLTYFLSLVATNTAWTYLTPPIYSFNIAPGAVASGGMIILYGGSDGTNSTRSAIGYNLGDGPVPLASMNAPRSYLGYAPDANGNAYAFGGLDDTGQALASAERYNQGGNTWTAIASLPAPRYDFPAVFNRTNFIYVFGGRTDATTGTETANVLRYSIRTNNWTAMASMPIAVAGSAATFGPDGKIYVVGGTSGGIPLDTVQVYEPASNSWTITTPLPEALSGSAMGVDSLGRLIVMGGIGADGFDTGDVWRSQPFGIPDSAPVLTQYPSTSGGYQIPYSSSITATGAPAPVYLLENGPDGMQVDYYSGAITWKPQANQIGTNPVTIRATNYAGSVDWNFTVNVTNPPPAPVSNLTVVSLSDNSVTLSWAPEDPVVGAVTYTANLRHVLHSPKGSGATVWYTQIGSSTTSPTLTIGGLSPGQSQVYYIAAAGSGGFSGYGSGVAAATTAPQGPPALFVTDVTSTSVSLAWPPAPGPAQNPLYSPITSYSIMERNTSVSPAVSVPTVTGITGTSGTVTGLTPGKSHTWFVSGVDVAGNASPIGIVYAVVVNPVPVSPQLSAAARLVNGNFQFTVQERGSAVQTVLVEANTSLADPAGWVQVGTVLPGSSAFTFTDTNAAQYPTRFYRTVAP